MPVAAVAGRNHSSPTRPTGGPWLGLFFLALFTFVALAQRPWAGSGWRGLLPTPVSATPSWSRAVSPRSVITPDGDGVTLLDVDPGDTRVVRLAPDGTVRQQGSAEGATLAVETSVRPLLIRPDPPAIGRLQAGGVVWAPIDPTTSTTQTTQTTQTTPAVVASAAGRADTVLVLAGPSDGTSPARDVLCLTSDGRKRWAVDVGEGVVTAAEAGEQGGFAIATFVPGAQAHASIVVLAADGAIRARFDLGSDPAFRTYLDSHEDKVLALDATHAWLLDIGPGSTRPVAMDAPVAGGFSAAGDIHVVTGEGLVVSLNQDGQTIWQRQLAGEVSDLVEVPTGGLLVLGKNRLSALDEEGRGTWALALADAPRQVVVPPAGGQVVVLTASKLAGYRLPVSGASGR